MDAESTPEGETKASIVKEITISKSKYPDVAQHIEDAQAQGHSDILTVDRAGAAERRAEALKRYSKVDEKQLDEYPPAMFKEGGSGASIRPISPKDNMGAGARIGNLLRDVKDGQQVRIKVVE
jgi:filamentous hemagglutinin